MVPTIRAEEGVDVDLAHLPDDDPAVYEILNEADTPIDVARSCGGTCGEYVARSGHEALERLTLA